MNKLMHTDSEATSSGPACVGGCISVGAAPRRDYVQDKVRPLRGREGALGCVRRDCIRFTQRSRIAAGRPSYSLPTRREALVGGAPRRDFVQDTGKFLRLPL